MEGGDPYDEKVQSEVILLTAAAQAFRAVHAGLYDRRPPLEGTPGGLMLSMSPLQSYDSIHEDVVHIGAGWVQLVGRM